MQEKITRRKTTFNAFTVALLFALLLGLMASISLAVVGANNPDNVVNQSIAGLNGQFEMDNAVVTEIQSQDDSMAKFSITPLEGYEAIKSVTISSVNGDKSQSELATLAVTDEYKSVSSQDNNYCYDLNDEGVGTLSFSKVAMSEMKAEGKVEALKISGTALARTFTITYNLNSGSVASANPTTFTYGAPSPTLVSLPTKSNYTFMGFYTEQNGKGMKIYDANGATMDIWKIASNTTLYAYWVGNDYTVILNSGSDITSAGASFVSAIYGQAMPSIVVPTRVGYTFGGYYASTSYNNNEKYYNADGSSAKTCLLTGDTMLYARWNANTYTVTLDSGSGVTSAGTTSVTATYGEAMPSITAPTKSGPTFLGYFTEANGAGTQYYNADGTSVANWFVTADTTLHAYWGSILTINYYSFLGTNATYLDISTTTGVLSATSIQNPTTNGSNYVSVTLAHQESNVAPTITLSRNNDSYTYYIKVGSAPTTSDSTNSITYNGWTPTSGGSINVYIVQCYTVTYNANGSSDSAPAPSYKLHGTDLAITANTLTRSGYNANGWNTASDGSGSSYSTTYTADADVTLYAQWVIAGYSIVFAGNGNTGGSMASMLGLSLSDVRQLTSNTFEKTGDGFVGWKASGDLSASSAKWGTTASPTYPITTSTIIPDGAYIKNLATSTSGTVTLTAYWIQKKRSGTSLTSYSWSEIRDIAQGGATALSEHGFTKGDTSTIRGSQTVKLVDITSGRYQYTDGTRRSNVVFQFFNAAPTNISSSNSKINSTATNSGGWANCALRSYINATSYLNNYQNYSSKPITFVGVNVYSGKGGSTSWSGKSISENNYLFLPSVDEIFNGTSTRWLSGENDGYGQYTYFYSGSGAYDYSLLHLGTNNTLSWWTRSPGLGTSNQWCYMSITKKSGSSWSTGYGVHSAANTTGRKVFPCFAF